MDSSNGLVRLVKSILFTTLIFELAGAALSFLVFVQDYPPLRGAGHQPVPLGGGLQQLRLRHPGQFPEPDPLPGRRAAQPGHLRADSSSAAIGFLVIRELWDKRFRWRRLSMHARVVITVSLVLIAVGTVLLRFTENITWMGAFFHSVSARTAGFSTYPLGEFHSTGLMVLAVLMFIGASPGSTGGGIKTSTFFALLQGVKSAATNKSEKAFHYAVPRDAFRKAAVILLLALSVVVVGTFLMLVFDPEVTLVEAMFEVVSAFGTVGLSTGITPGLSDASKLLSIVIMYIGRLGPLTIASLWYFSRGERISYPEGNLAIG